MAQHPHLLSIRKETSRGPVMSTTGVDPPQVSNTNKQQHLFLIMQRRGGRGGRNTSGPWSRLKPAIEDPLEEFGLPSKGDKRLLSHPTQERYYTKIAERYMAFCTNAGNSTSLLKQFASLRPITATTTTTTTTTTAATTTTTTETTTAAAATAAAASAPERKSNAPTTLPSPAPQPPSAPTPASARSSLTSPSGHKDLAHILGALRKLREGIVASKRADRFASQVYLFAVRIGALCRSPETYHPAALHLLRVLHPRHGLTSVELHEVVAYLALDAACRRGDLAEAFELRARHRLRDAKVDALLRALAQDNWLAFARARQGMDGYKAGIAEFAEPDVRRHLLKAFGRAYLAVPLRFLESSTGLEWAELQAEYGVGWELDDSRVIIRKVQSRA